MAYQDAIGQSITAAVPRIGIKWIRLVTDVPTATREIVEGRLSVGEYLASLAGPKEFAVESLNDPLPGLFDLLLVPYYIKHRGL